MKSRWLWLVAAVVAGALGLTLIGPSQATHTSFATGDVVVGVGEAVDWYHPDGSPNRPVAVPPHANQLAGLAFGPGGELYGAGSYGVIGPGQVFEGTAIAKFNRFGVYVGPFGNTTVRSYSILFDKRGDFYAGQAGGDQVLDPEANAIVKLDAQGNLVGKFAAAEEKRLSGTRHIDLAADQCTVYYTSGGRRVLRYDVCGTGQLPDFVSALGTSAGSVAQALRILPNGDVLVATHALVYRLSPSNEDSRTSVGRVVQTYDPSPPSVGGKAYSSLNLDPDGVSFWVGDYVSSRIYKLNIADGGARLAFDLKGVDGSHRPRGIVIKDEITNAAPTRVDISDAAPVTESDAGSVAATFTVTLNAEAQLPVAVGYVTRDGTAKAGEDYTDTKGQLVFSPGEVSRTVSVPVLGDTTTETTERFFVDLVDPVNAGSVRTRGEGVIFDNDKAPVEQAEKDRSDSSGTDNEGGLGDQAAQPTQSPTPAGQSATGSQAAGQQAPGSQPVGQAAPASQPATQQATVGQAAPASQPVAQPAPGAQASSAQQSGTQSLAPAQGQLQQQLQVQGQAQPAFMMEQERELQIERARLHGGDGGQWLASARRAELVPAIAMGLVASLLMFGFGLPNRSRAAQQALAGNRSTQMAARRQRLRLHARHARTHSS